MAKDAQFNSLLAQVVNEVRRTPLSHRRSHAGAPLSRMSAKEVPSGVIRRLRHSRPQQMVAKAFQGTWTLLRLVRPGRSWHLTLTTAHTHAAASRFLNESAEVTLVINARRDAPLYLRGRPPGSGVGNGGSPHSPQRKCHVPARRKEAFVCRRI